MTYFELAGTNQTHYIRCAMQSPISTRDPETVQLEVRSLYLKAFPRADPEFVLRIFSWALECFTGGYGYQAVDTRYHDLEHTLQGALCMARLLYGRQQANAHPVLSKQVFELGLLAMLLHDSGYLKRVGDNEGTGAKYTAIHVDRSAHFAAELLSKKGFPPEDIQAVQSMIRCTGLNARVEAIPFATQQHRIAGYALATADYLGQMSADDYVDKLPVLYEEFAEALAYSRDSAPQLGNFHNAQDLIRKTPDFWDKFVKPRLDRDFLGLYKFLNDPYPDGPNEYLERVEANIARLRGTNS